MSTEGEEIEVGEIKNRAKRAEEAQELDERQREAERLREMQQFEQQNRERLEEIFKDRFHPDDPPECYTRWKEFTSAGNLVKSILNEESENLELQREIVDHISTFNDADLFLTSILANEDVDKEIKKYASEHLKSVREEKESKTTLREALAEWIAP